MITGAEVRRWVAAAVGPGARVTRVRRLVGGITSAVHHVTVERSDGSRQHLVLRRWGDPADRAAVAALAEHEAAILTALAGHAELAAPRLLACDPTGAASGGDPAVLMTKLPGRIHLTPTDPDGWLRQLAALLPRIHAAPIAAPPYQPWFDPDTLAAPGSSPHPEIWRTAIDLVRAGRPPADSVFLHRDFQHFNILWAREQVTGVVDWLEASTGPADVDIAHCRLNLAVLFSADWAERFRRCYEAEAGRATNPWFDLASLVGYGQLADMWQRFIPVQVGRRAVVDVAGMDARVEDLLRATLARC